MSAITLSKKEAITFLGIEENEFKNYFESSGEIVGKKVSGKWVFDKKHLQDWKNMKKNHTVFLSRKEYEKCFVFAIQMAYSKSSSAGTFGATRTEVEQADNWILGILAEFGLKKFLKNKFGKNVKLDTEAHPERGITAQDIVQVDGRDPKMKVGVKSSKPKSCWNVIPPNEYENKKRKSDVYVFARAFLPSDHLFRILRGHSFFKQAHNKLETKIKKQSKKISKIEITLKQETSKLEQIDRDIKNLMMLKNVQVRKSKRKKLCKKKKSIKKQIENRQKEISKLDIFKKMDLMPNKIPIWICGFSEHSKLHEVIGIPNQSFTRGTNENGDENESYRYVAPVSEMKNSDKHWKKFADRL